MSNTKGSTTAFATFSPYKSKASRFWSQVTLRLGDINTAAMRKEKFLHTAQFCPVTPKQLRRAGLASKGLEQGGLLFMSYFNGTADDYFRGFAKDLWKQMDDVWCWCTGWTTTEPPVGRAADTNFKNIGVFIQKYERRSASYFNAYPDGSASVRAALVLRREIDELQALAVDQPGVSDSQFAEAFARMSQRLWGNGA